MPARLLVIDDEPGIARVITRIVSRVGFETRVVNDPREALAVFLDYKPLLTMVDMIMPGYNGIDIIHQILRSGIPSRLVLMSGYEDADLRLATSLTKLRNAPDIRILRKPFRRKELSALLEELIQRSG